jgi:hypothetical protein
MLDRFFVEIAVLLSERLQHIRYTETVSTDRSNLKISWFMAGVWFCESIRAPLVYSGFHKYVPIEWHTFTVSLSRRMISFSAGNGILF